MSWPLGTVSELAQVISGYAFKSTCFGEGSSKVIRIGDLKNGRIDVENAACFDENANPVKEQFKIREGDILMALSGATVGKIAVATFDTVGCYLNQRVAIVRSKSPESADYLKYVFSGSYLDKLLLSAGGAAQPNLSPKDLASMEIPLPPLDEQKRIAAILDKADAIRRKRQQAIDLADDFLRSVFLDMFGDPCSYGDRFEMFQLADVCKKITDGEHGTVERLKAGELYLMARNISKEGRIDTSEVSYISKDDHERIYKRCGPEEGDVLLVCVGATIGKAAIVPKMEQFSLARSVALLKPNTEVIKSEFLLQLIKSKWLQHHFVNSGNSSAQAGLYLGKIKETTIPVPPIDLQNKFKLIATSIKSLLEKHNVSGIDSSNAFNSLSQKAFAGEL